MKIKESKKENRSNYTVVLFLLLSSQIKHLLNRATIFKNYYGNF